VGGAPLRWAARIAAILVALPLVLLVLYRFVPPPGTPLMLIRAVEGEGIDKAWRSLAAISPQAVRAVMAAEDARFCRHHGFDWVELGNAWSQWRRGGRLRGGSTISQQTTKNLFLWPGRDFVRKAIEAALTVPLELLWSKARIIEVYLNIVEWGPGIYGVEAAARHYFARPAAALTRREAALLAAILPNPRRWSASRPTPYIRARAATIEARMSAVGRGRPVCPD
jgi:monofunctional biosynthetic peptidoglycan transglycosylase